jgi:hypothetical protein
MAEALPLEDLPPELRSRVMAATAHAQHRFVARAGREDHDAIEPRYEVHAVAGDRYVHMLLALRPDASVEEATETFLRDRILLVEREGDHATIEVDDAAGRRSITIPLATATALGSS